MLEGSTEKDKDGKVMLKLEVEGVDVTSDTSAVIYIFLTFLYSGKLEDSEETRNMDPVWLELLPALVKLAVKVSGLV